MCFVFTYIISIFVVSIFCNRFLSTVKDIYGEVTNWLISNEFTFSFKENGSGML